jgi:hypothetical protein
MANDMAISFQDVRGAAGNRPRSTMNIAASRTIPGVDMEMDCGMENGEWIAIARGAAQALAAPRSNTSTAPAPPACCGASV